MIDLIKSPVSKKYSITAIADNGGFARLEISGNFNLIGRGNNIAIFTTIGNGIYKILDFTSPDPNVILCTIDLAYTSDGTGICFIDTKNNSNCNFHAVNNTPTLFRFQRRDIEIIQVADLGGKLNICLTGDWSAILLEDDYLYCNLNLDGVESYNENAIITGVVYHGAYNYTWVCVDIDYVDNANFGFVNSNVYKQNYSLSVVLNCSFSQEAVNLIFYPDPKGIINCDISRILNNYLVESDSQDFKTVNYSDIEKFGNYQLNYKEIWVNTDDTYHDLDELFCFIFARIELLKDSNLFNYTVNDVDKRAKWLNKGVQNIYTKLGIVQYPIDFSILAGAQITKSTEVLLNESKQEIESNDYNFVGDSTNTLTRVTLQGEYPTNDYIELFLDGLVYGFSQFSVPITDSGKVLDLFSAGFGQLKNANCLVLDVDSILSLPEGYVISQLSYKGDCIISAVGNQLICSGAGKLYDLAFADQNNWDYHFVCAERYTETKESYLIHGSRNTGLAVEGAYLIAENITFGVQDEYFGQVMNGMDKNTYSGDEIWTAKNFQKEETYQGGLEYVPAEFLVTEPYFDVNTWILKPQNNNNSGFNAFDQITYLPNPENFWDLSAFGITDSTEWTYDEFITWLAAHPTAQYDIDANGIVTNFKLPLESTSGQLTEKLFIKNNCDPGGLYLKWLNLNGGYEYELFEYNQVNGIETDGKDIIERVYNSTVDNNEKQRSFGGKTKETIELFKMLLPQVENDIDNFERFKDLKKAGYLNDIWVFVSKFVCDLIIIDNDSTLAGTCKVVCPDKHLLKTGSKVNIKDTGYSETTDFEVFVLDEYSYYINLAYNGSYLNSGYHKKLIENTDWLRCQLNDCDLTRDTQRGTFDINLTIELPSYE